MCVSCDHYDKTKRKEREREREREAEEVERWREGDATKHGHVRATLLGGSSKRESGDGLTLRKWHDTMAHHLVHCSAGYSKTLVVVSMTRHCHLWVPE